MGGLRGSLGGWRAEDDLIYHVICADERGHTRETGSAKLFS